MYEFTQDCLTGIDQIDEEHRKLFSLINEAVELPKEARTPQTVKNILEHLSDYAVNHFAHEEAYMEAQNDPELPLQKKEHQAFADHVKLLEKQPLTGENASAMLDEILTYLVRWLYRHILSSDMMIGKMQKEDPFVFTAKYYTGIELVDREHRKLFEIIGEVNALIHNDLLHDKYDEIVRLLDELREYTKFHFEDEEAYMQKINSPMLEQLGRIVRRAVEQLERLLEPVEMLHLPRGVLVALRVLLDGGFPREHPPEREALRPREGDGAVHLQPQFRGPLVALDGVIPEHHPVPTGARHLQAVGQAVLLIRHHQHVPPTLVFRQPGGRAAGVLGESGRLKGEGLPRRLFRDAGQIPAVASGPQRTLRRTGRLRRGRPRSSGSRRRQQQGQSRQQGRGP